MYRITFIFLFLFDLTQITFAQTSPALINSSLAEQINILTDRELYLTGEDIWFSAYISNTNSLPISKILYVELFNSENSSIASQKLVIDSGIVHSHFTIPDKLVSGYYYIRAYTKLLRNFSTDYFSIADFKIINPTQSLPEDKKIIDAEFYIEGGAVNFNHTNTISLKLSPNLADSVLSSTIENENNQKLTDCHIYTNGLGVAYLNCNSNESYFLKLQMKNKTLRTFKIPIEEKKDISISSTNLANGININLYTQEYQANKGNIFKIEIINSKQNIIFSNSIILKDTTTIQFIPFSKLANGLNIIQLKNNNNQTKAFYFKYLPYNSASSVSIESNKEEYKSREKVQINVAHSKNIVYETLSVTFKNNSGLINELDGKLLYDRKTLENYITHFEITDTAIVNQINLLLIQHNNDTILLNNLIVNRNKTTKLVYLPETTGIELSGIIDNHTTNENSISNAIFVAVFGKNKQLHISKLNTENEFSVTLNDLYNNQNIYICPADVKGVSPTIKIDNDFEKTTSNLEFGPFYISPDDKTMLNALYINAQLNKLMLQDSILLDSFKISNKQFINDTTLYDANILLKNYISFSTLKDVFREIVPLTNLIDNKEEQKIKLYNTSKKVYLDNILIVLDNVPVYDIGQLFKMNPAQIERIIVINKQYFFGNSLFNGIISIQTKLNDFANYKFPQNSCFLNYNTVTKSTFPVDKQYFSNETIKDKSPDFRTTLYWNARLTTKESSSANEFYTSDAKGSYQITYTAINKEGKIVQQNKLIEVK